MPTLILEFPNGRKKEYLVTGEKVGLGRKPDNAIHIPDSYVSGRHAEFQRTADGGYELVDLGSHNGTEVNGKRAQRSPLRDGDRISFGVVEGRFRTADPAPATPPTSAVPGAPRTGPQTAPMSPAAMLGPTQRIRPMTLTPVPLQPPGAEAGPSTQQLKAARDELAATRKDVDTAKAELETVRKETEEARAQMERTVAEAKTLTEALEASRKAQGELAAQAAAATAEAQTARAEAATARAEAEAARSEAETARADAEKARLDAESHRKGIQTEEQRLTGLRQSTETLQRQEQSLTERLQILHRQQFLLERRLRESSPSLQEESTSSS